MARESKKVVVHQQKRRPSLRYLASKVGVSHTVVARALRNDPTVNAELLKKIQEVAREEGYLASDVTQSLITGWSGTIGVIVPRIFNIFISHIVSNVIGSLWEDRITPLVLCSELDPSREEQMIQAMAAKRVGGLIIMPCHADRDKDHFVHLIKQHTPIVTLDDHMPQVNAPLVGSNDDRGGELVTEHLIAQGHRHILHLGSASEGGHANNPRGLAYARVMAAHGLQPQTIHMPHLKLLSEEIQPMLDQWFDSPEGKKTTAVFAFNDYAAFCVYQYAQRHGRVIGKDLAVVGYSNMQGSDPSMTGISSLVSPSLSSVEQFPEKWGTAAVDILRKMIAGQPVPEKTLLEPELIIRESSNRPF